MTGICGENLTWTLDGNTLTISGTGDMYDLQNFSEVGESIERVIVAEGATSIGEFAFSFCANIIAVTLPDSLSKICVGAFNFCESLTEIKIPANVTTIGKSAFCGCWSLREISLPANLVDIGDNAFINCSNLRVIELPDGLRRIGENAFKGCENLTEIKIPASVVEVGGEVFTGCEALKKIYCAASLDFAKNLRGGNNAELVAANETVEKFTWQLDGDTLTIISADKLKSLSHDENAPWYDKRESIKKIIIKS